MKYSLDKVDKYLGKPVRVDWVDAAGKHEGWVSARNMSTSPENITAYGFMAKSAKTKEHGEYITISSHKSDGGNFLATVAVPLAWIKKITKVPV